MIIRPLIFFRGAATSNHQESTSSVRLARSTRKGSAVLETGLLLPVLMLMACGSMDLARVFYAGIVVENAARAGVQRGSFSIGDAGAITKMNSAGSNDASGQGLTGVVVSSRTFCGCNTSTSELSCSETTCDGKVPSGYVETTANYTFTPMIPYPGIPTSIVLSSSAKFRAQ
jgi:Flp pilus assembly protein TadG